MGDDATVQRPGLGNKYLGHGPQTLARLCPTFSEERALEVVEVVRFISEGGSVPHFPVCAGCSTSNLCKSK